MISFQLQDHQIVPVFMLAYDDFTYRMIPFVATTKATFYRKVSEILAMPDFDEVEAVFYCGEYYLYDSDQFSGINEKTYSDRISQAKAEVLSFCMTLKGGGKMEICFDEQKIDDIEYVAQQIQGADWCKEPRATFDWLNPIRQKLMAKSDTTSTEGEKLTE